MNNIYKKLLCGMMAAVLCIVMAIPVCADIADPVYDDHHKVVFPSEPLVERVVDAADILTDSEEAALLETCNEISERQQIDVAVVTVAGLGGLSSTAYADDYFDYNGLGQGSDRSGIILLISMENRDWAISTCGRAISYFTDAGQEYMVGEFKGYLSDGKYYEAFDLYARLCNDFIGQAKNGRPYDVGHLPQHSLRPFSEVALQKAIVVVLVSLVLAFLLWLIICTIEKKKLTSVSFKGQADDYIRKGSINITGRTDTFLYKHTTKRYNPPSSSSGGGSSTHTSSSGSSHGGSSGHF